MKRVVVITAMAVLALVAGFSAPQAGSKFELGPKLGLNLMTVGGDDANNLMGVIDDDPGYLTGFTVAGFGRVYLSEYVALQFELAYVQKGSEWEFDVAESVKFTAQVRLDYIEIPVLLSLHIPTQSALSPFISAGGSVGFKSSSKFKAKISGSGIDDEAESYKILNASGTQFNLIFGAGVGFNLGTNRLELSANYSMGMGNAFEDADDPGDAEDDEIYMVDYITGDVAQLKTRQISILAQFAFGL
ncbi:MAG: PorT family protein [Candidatus Zixiibacteriota bacterium]|nr:MAG: PorT family protein [candidate division Zixibacteria bacterium]